MADLCTKGNTRVVPKSQGYQLTLNEVDRYDELRENLLSYKSLRYLIACKERAPTTGHEHIHVYVNFQYSIRLSPKKMAGAHIERCGGSPKQNIAYIEKGEVFEEYGDRPHQGPMSVKDLKEIKNPEDLPDWRAYHTWKMIQQDNEEVDLEEEMHKEVEVVFFTGPSGCGKTMGAKRLLRERGVKKYKHVSREDGFWHGVGDGTGAALYDDFRSGDMKAKDFVCFIDYNVQNMNVKGGNVRNQFNLILITSVERPEKIYKNIKGEPREQWLRRMKIVDMWPNDDEDDDDLLEGC